jgi:hypothetical protein
VTFEEEADVRKRARVWVGIVLACAGLSIPAQAQQVPSGNPQDFKLKTCLHSVSYAGVWRGQAALSVFEGRSGEP